MNIETADDVWIVVFLAVPAFAALILVVRAVAFPDRKDDDHA